MKVGRPGSHRHRRELLRPKANLTPKPIFSSDFSHFIFAYMPEDEKKRKKKVKRSIFQGDSLPHTQKNVFKRVGVFFWGGVIGIRRDSHEKIRVRYASDLTMKRASTCTLHVTRIED